MYSSDDRGTRVWIENSDITNDCDLLVGQKVHVSIEDISNGRDTDVCNEFIGEIIEIGEYCVIVTFAEENLVIPENGRGETAMWWNNDHWELYMAN